MKSVTLSCALLVVGSLTVYGPLWVIRDAGAAIGVRQSGDTDMRWRVQATGTVLAGDGQSPPKIAWGYADGSYWIDGSFLELTTSGEGGQEVGLSINDRTTGSGAFGLASAEDTLTIWQLNHNRRLMEFDVDGEAILQQPGAGLWLTSPDGLTHLRLSVDNDGNLVTEAVLE